jgi:hypothetical protein
MKKQVKIIELSKKEVKAVAGGSREGVTGVRM